MSLMEDAEKAIDKQFMAVVDQIQFDMKDKCPKDTGALRNSIYTKWNGKRDAVVTSRLRASNGHQILDYIENGNGQGIIEPKRAQALAIGKERGNRTIIYRKRVRTYRGRHFVRKIAERYRKKYG